MHLYYTLSTDMFNFNTENGREGAATTGLYKVPTGLHSLQNWALSQHIIPHRISHDISIVINLNLMGPIGQVGTYIFYTRSPIWTRSTSNSASMSTPSLTWLEVSTCRLLSSRLSTLEARVQFPL